MIRKPLAILGAMIFAISLAAATENPVAQSQLSAAEVVNRNIAARGGLQAWRGVQAVSMEGKLGVGGNQRSTLPLAIPGTKVGANALPQRPAQEVELPFVMEFARPRKERFELQFNGQTAIQVYDGSNGWKLRPYLNRLEVENFTADEMKAASLQPELDGPLVDYAAKGTKVELAGMEKVDDRDTYKLKLTLKNGNSLHVWIDAQSFLETKIEGQPRRLDGISHPVEVYFSDYRAVSGLQFPFVLETKVLPVAQTKNISVPVEKIAISKVVVNPKLDQSAFSKPQVPAAVPVKK